MVRRGAIAAVLAAASLVASCGSGDTTAPPQQAEPLAWKSCDGVECADLVVPFDYSGESDGTFTLRLSRQPALKPTERIGVLLVNPGGPGAPGRSLAQNAAYYFSRDVIDRFDIVAWDPRGTGESTPAVDCIDDYDAYFRQPFTSETARAFVDACSQRSGRILPHVGTADSARDIDAIRRALDIDRVSYFGFSYGGVLGLVWQSMFPDTVRAIVLDAPPNPVASRAERITAQAAAFENLLREFLRMNDLATTFDALTESPPDGLTKHMILAAAVSALYDESAWAELATAITEAQQGDVTKVVAMYEGYYYQDPGYEAYKNTFEASAAIACLDDTQRKATDDMSMIAPRLHTFFAPDLLCANWPTRNTTDDSVSLDERNGTPTLVIGATQDPASPFGGVRAAVKAAGSARLITVDARRHTSYLAVDCVTTIVDSYLIDLVVPPDTTCTDQRAQT